MRDLKFRAWDSRYLTMFYPTTSLHVDWDKHYGSKLLCEIACAHGYRNLTDDHEYHEIMQFTGLKDKNGNDIYEGDIISSKGGLTVYVKWNEEHAAFMYVNNFGFSAVLSGGDSVEVIGNIHQNKELLTP